MKLRPFRERAWRSRAAGFCTSRKPLCPGNHPRRRRSVLQYARPAKISARGVDRAGPCYGAGDPLCPGSSRKALRTDFGQPYAAVRHARYADCRTDLSDFWEGDTGQLLPFAAETPLERAGLPEPPPWKVDPNQPVRIPGTMRLTGFYSSPSFKSSIAIPSIFCKQAAYSRPAASARPHGGVSQCDSSHQLSSRAPVPRNASRRGGCERAPGQD